MPRYFLPSDTSSVPCVLYAIGPTLDLLSLLLELLDLLLGAGAALVSVCLEL
jgi:hypothetical protein